MNHPSAFMSTLAGIGLGRSMSICLFLIAAPLLQAGAWTPQKGKTYLKLAGNQFTSFANFDTEGNRVDLFEDFEDRYSRFRDRNLTVYFETGLYDDLALFGSVVYKEIEQRTVLGVIDPVGDANNGFADVELGLRYRLSEGPNIWSVAFLAKLPYLYDTDEFFSLGNGQEDFEGRLLYGRSLGKGFYTGLEAGYRLRLEDPSDEYRFLAELGWGSRRFYARAKLDGVRAVDSFEPQTSFGSNPMLNPQFDLTKLELTAGVNLGRGWSLEYTYTDTLDGKNTAEGENNQWAVVAVF